MSGKSNQTGDYTRTIIIGDVHGCFDELQAILKKVAYSPQSDRLIMTGDVISKGPYPFKTLQFCREINAEVVAGNHEYAFMLYLQGKKPPYSGFLQLKQNMLPDIEQWQEWFEHLPLFIATSEFLVVHAGLHPSLPVEKTDPHILTTIRTWDGKGESLNCENDPPWFDFYTGKKLVIFGHWAKRGLVVRDNVTGLDSGCVYGNDLSALILPERKIVQVKAAQTYQQIS
ncbi:MAG: metallophosphoesterase [Endozoicomonadaceae bacterium]|nr:metallophosphoesterase [Endozoicomonadaceae bacterium]